MASASVADKFLESLSTSTLTAGKSLDVFRQVVDALTASTRKLMELLTGSVLKAGGTPPQTAAAAVGSGSPAGSKPKDKDEGSIGGVFSGVFGALSKSITAPIAAFGALTGAITSFAGAANPTSLLIFQQAIDDLSAVIGSALQPVMTSITGIVRSFADTLLPLVGQLRPVFQSLAESLSKVGGVIVSAFGAALQSLVPVFKFVAGVIDALVPVVQSLYAHLAGLFQVVKSLIGSFLGLLGFNAKDALDGFKSAMQTLAESMLRFNALMLKLIDNLFKSDLLGDYIKGTKRAFGDGAQKADSTGFAPAKNAQISDLSSFSKTLSTAAYLAGPSGVLNKEDKFKEDILKVLNEIKNKPLVLQRYVILAVRRVIDTSILPATI